MSQHVINMLIIQILTTDCKQKHLVYDFFFLLFFSFLQPVAFVSLIELVENQTNGII